MVMEKVHVDSITLIKLVEERPALWHQQNANYSNRSVHQQEWAAISKELKCPIPICKTKWKNIRDVYRKECKKLEQKIEKKSRWCHFDKLKFIDNPVVENEIDWDDSSDLQFIKDETIVSAGTENYDYDPEEETSDPEEENCEPQQNIKPAPMLTPAPNYVLIEDDEQQYKSSKQRRLNDSLRNDNDDNSMTKNDEENDSDYHFLMSLLPFLRKVPISQKLSLRCQIQQLIAQAGNSEKI